MIHKIQWLFLLSVVLVSCNNDDINTTTIEEPVVAGSANFSKYVALGDSFAAGYGNGALFIKGQEYAYPSILAQQFMAAGGGSFKVPYMNDNTGGLLLGGNKITNVRLYFNNAAPVYINAAPTTEVTQKITGPFNNLGVPGAKSYHLITPGYGNVAGVAGKTANPYYARFSTSATSTVLEDALAQSPTFFSLWIGGNDVLGYALSGGVTKTQDPTNGDDITPISTFNTAYDKLITDLTAKGAKGVVANLPSITAMPYFTTIPYNPLTAKLLGSNDEAVGQATITALNTQLYGPLKQALTAFGQGDRISLLSSTLANPLLIKDENLTNLSAQLTAAFTPTLGAATAAFYGSIFGQARQAKSTDLILLGTLPIIASAPIGIPYPLDKYGITYPLEDKHVLISSEIDEIKTATVAYNEKITAMATSKGLAFVDTNTILNNLSSATGIKSNGFTLTSAFVTGGAFSLDGIHLTARGYAYLSNAFIDAINLKFGATLKKVDIGFYPLFYPEILK